MKQAFGELYNVSGTSFIKVYINMTTSVRFILSHDCPTHRTSAGNTFTR